MQEFLEALLKNICILSIYLPDVILLPALQIRQSSLILPARQVYNL
jgi:hypothetical protein